MEETQLLFALAKKIFLQTSVQWFLLLGLLHLAIEVFSINSCPSISEEENHFLENLHQSQQEVFSKTSTAESSFKKEAARFLIFVSFSLPDTTLKSLYRDAQKIGGKLILQGLYQNSFKKTVLKLRELEIEIVIDPLLFKKYSITAVPTLLLLEEEKGTLLRGHVSLSYTLQHMADQGRLSAKKLLKQLEGVK